VVFGGNKKHISGKWRERRQGMLFAVGKKHSKGNGNLRLVWADIHGEAKE
jgi:hypothetical protein